MHSLRCRRRGVTDGLRRNARRHRRARLWLPWPRLLRRKHMTASATTRLHLYVRYPRRYRWKSDLQQGTQNLVRVLPSARASGSARNGTVGVTISQSDHRCNPSSSSTKSLNCAPVWRPRLAFPAFISAGGNSATASSPSKVETTKSLKSLAGGPSDPSKCVGSLVEPSHEAQEGGACQGSTHRY